MNKEDQHHEEERILETVTSIFPGFTEGIRFARVDEREQPPDFLGKDQDGRNIGLELTCWLNHEQARASRGRESMGKDLLSLLEWETPPRPGNVSSVVVTPRWGKKIAHSHRQDLRREFYAAVQLIDSTWERLKATHWGQLPEGGAFDYEAYEHELKGHPTLNRYVSSIWFYQPQERSSFAADRSWITVNSVGPDSGLYDPNVAIHSLRRVITQKIHSYDHKPQPKERLRAHSLYKLYLLVYADPVLSRLNTPFQTCYQMRRSPTEGLFEAAKLATKELSEFPKVFDGIFLHYSLWNSQWLALIWPELQQFSAACQPQLHFT